MSDVYIPLVVPIGCFVQINASLQVDCILHVPFNDYLIRISQRMLNSCIQRLFVLYQSHWFGIFSFACLDNTRVFDILSWYGVSYEEQKNKRTLSLLLAKLFVWPLVNGTINCKTVGFFSKSVKKSGKRGLGVLRARSAPASHACRACEARLGRDAKESIFSVSPQSHFPFSASFQTFCLTAQAYLNTQRYGLFCSLTEQGTPTVL